MVKRDSLEKNNRFIELVKGVFSIKAGEAPLTSDHLPQSITTNLEIEETSLKLSGATWNLLKKCKTNLPRTNNPFRITETAEEYEERKLVQIKEIEDIMSSKHFMLLQEADFLTDSRKESTTEEIVPFMQAVQKLESSGIKFLSIADFIKGTNIKNSELGIIYKKEMLEPIDGSQRLLFASKSGNQDEPKGFGYEFKILKDANGKDISSHNKTVLLISVHLDFSKNYSNDPEMMEFLKSHEEAGNFVILGGDTNHPIGDRMPFETMGIKSETKSTTFELAPSTENGPWDKVIISHPGASITRYYDGFYVMPPEAKITSQEGYLYEKINEQFAITSYTYDRDSTVHTVETKLIGLPADTLEL